MNSEPVILELPGIQAVFHSSAMQRLLQMVERVAHHNAAVLIIGETGTGKELIARAVHHHSLRSDQTLVDVNCGALPEHLVESELFGFEKGAFSGADSSKPGFFELAHKGTLFLDEVGELEPKLQVKLLRVLDGVPYYRLGGTKKVAVDVRLVAATNQELQESVQQGRFRGDLYHRLSQFQLRVPPLRERKEDIVLLAEHFLKSNCPGTKLSSESISLLQTYRWPGNVRELRNVMIRAAALCTEGIVRAQDLPSEIQSYVPELVSAAAMPTPYRPVVTKPATPPPAPGGLRDVKKQRMLEALARHNGHQGLAADELGISRRTLSRQLKQFRADGQQNTEALGILSLRQQNYFRNTLEVTVELKTEEGFTFTTQSLNISLGGIGLLQVPLEAQNSLKIALRFPLPGTPVTVSADAQICWCTRDGRAGLRFIRLDDKTTTELKRWMLQKQLEEGWTSLK